MRRPQVEVRQKTILEPVRDGRLLPYGVLAFLVTAAAVVVGEPGLVPLAVPFAIALALGLRRTEPVEVTARFVLFADRVLEDDPIEGHVELTWNGPSDAALLLHRLRGVIFAPGSPASASESATERIQLPIRFIARQWGRHRLGEVWLRLTLPFGLVSWTGRVMTGPAVRILPGSERLSQLLSPTESRTVWGVHRSPRLGDGHDFAELRPYTPGDRLRDVNWAATARHGVPIVNRYHTEVSGDVVLALEAPDDGSSVSRAILAKTARLAWGLASVHMRANDRVGLVGLGGSSQWLPPAGGRLAQYKLMEALLRLGGEAAEMVEVRRRFVDVPRSALVVALSTLHDDHSLLALMSWRARGRSVAVIVIDATTLDDPRESRPELFAKRLWGLELERRIADLRRAGIAVVRAPVDAAVAPVVSALDRARRARSTRRK